MKIFSIADAIIDYLAEKKNVYLSDLLEEVKKFNGGISEEDVRKVLNTLEEEGLIKISYKLTKVSISWIGPEINKEKKESVDKEWKDVGKKEERKEKEESVKVGVLAVKEKKEKEEKKKKETKVVGPKIEEKIERKEKDGEKGVEEKRKEKKDKGEREERKEETKIKEKEIKKEIKKEEKGGKVEERREEMEGKEGEGRNEGKGFFDILEKYKFVIVGVLAVVVIFSIGLVILSNVPSSVPVGSISSVAYVQNETNESESKPIVIEKKEKEEKNKTVEEIKVIYINSSLSGFVPSVIEVEKGKKVKLIISNSGDSYYLRISDYNVSVFVEREGVVEFLANKEGVFYIQGDTIPYPITGKIIVK